MQAIVPTMKTRRQRRSDKADLHDVAASGLRDVQDAGDSPRRPDPADRSRNRPLRRRNGADRLTARRKWDWGDDARIDVGETPLCRVINVSLGVALSLDARDLTCRLRTYPRTPRDLGAPRLHRRRCLGRRCPVPGAALRTRRIGGVVRDHEEGAGLLRPRYMAGAARRASEGRRRSLG